MSQLRTSYTYDAAGNPIGSFMGSINTHDAHVHREIINHQFEQRSTTVTTTFAVASSPQDTAITVVSSTGFTVGDYIHITDTFNERTNPFIISIVGNVITFNKPLDYGYAIGSIVEKTVINMNVDGSTTRQSFIVEPPTGETWHLMRILIEMTHTTAGDNGLFGNLAKLTNGVLLRRYDGTTGIYNTFTTWQTNSDIVTDMYDVVYTARSGGGGAYGTNGRGTFERAGAIVFLDATAGDFLEIYVQDDLTGLDSFTIKAQGHIEGS